MLHFSDSTSDTYSGAVVLPDWLQAGEPNTVYEAGGTVYVGGTNPNTFQINGYLQAPYLFNVEVTLTPQDRAKTVTSVEFDNFTPDVGQQYIAALSYATPEPSSFVLVCGAAALLIARRRKARAA